MIRTLKQKQADALDCDLARLERRAESYEWLKGIGVIAFIRIARIKVRSFMHPVDRERTQW